MEVSVERERPDSDDAVSLIKELDLFLYSLYPSDGCYCLSPEQLIRDNVAFFIARVDGAAVGCGALRPETDGYAELKRMFVRPSIRRKGIAKAILQRLERHAAENGVAVVRLETGKYQTEAIALYERAGYRRIPRFGNYPEDGFSLFFEKRLL